MGLALLFMNASIENQWFDFSDASEVKRYNKIIDFLNKLK